MTVDEIRNWLLEEAEKEGLSYQEAKRRGHDTSVHWHRVDMLARVLWMTGLAERRIASDLLRRYLGEDVMLDDDEHEADGDR